MGFVAASIGIGVGAIAGIGGAVIQGNATRDAAQTQADAANRANQQQWDMYQQNRADQQPWREAGAGALGQMQDPYFQKNFGASDFQTDPGYAFRMQQGQQALERSAAARGGLMSGGTLRALSDYGQNTGSQEYQNAYNRFTNDQTNRFNRLGSIAGLGQTANSQLGQFGMNTANQMGSNSMGAANAMGAARIAQGNQMGGAISGIGNNWMQYQMMNRFMPQSGGGGGSIGGMGGASGGGGGYGGGYGLGYNGSYGLGG